MSEGGWRDGTAVRSSLAETLVTTSLVDNHNQLPTLRTFHETSHHLVHRICLSFSSYLSFLFIWFQSRNLIRGRKTVGKKYKVV